LERFEKCDRYFSYSLLHEVLPSGNSHSWAALVCILDLVTIRSAVSYACMEAPNAVIKEASRTASESVGWAWHVRAMSSDEAPNSIAMQHS
jgi:hypothetical protein